MSAPEPTWTVGQEVVVVYPPYRHGQRVFRGEVVKVARVNVTVRHYPHGPERAPLEVPYRIDEGTENTPAARGYPQALSRIHTVASWEDRTARSALRLRIEAHRGMFSSFSGGKGVDSASLEDMARVADLLDEVYGVPEVRS